MAYLRGNYIDKNGRNNENAYTHIESYSINVVKKMARINLITYVSEKAKDSKYLPIEQESEVIKGTDYDVIFGEESLTTSTTRNSDNLRVIYEKLNKITKWQAESVEPVFEVIIKDVGERKIDEEISRKIAVEEKLVENEDFIANKVLVEE